MSLRGKGFEWPVDELEPADVAESAGETEPPRPRFCPRVIDVDRFMEGLEPKFPGLVPNPGCILMTPAAIPPATGTRTAGGGGAGEVAGCEGGVTCAPGDCC